MFSDYSVIRISNHSPSGSYSPKEHPAAAMRKYGMENKDARKNAIANLTDDEIILTSLEYAQNKTDKTVAGKLKNALPSLFVTAVPLFFGAICKGSLSDKTKMALATAMIFGGAKVLSDKYDNGMDRIENASKKVENKRKEHPAVASLFDIAAKGALVFGASLALIKGGKYAQNKFKPSVDKLTDSIKKTSEIIDNTAIGRGVSRLNAGTDNFLNKHPKLSGFLSNNVFLAPALTLLGWMGFEGAVKYKAAENTYNHASQMADTLFIQREIARN